MNLLFITKEVNLLSGWGVISYNILKEAVKDNSVTVMTLKNAKNVPIYGVKTIPLSLLKNLNKSKTFIYLTLFINKLIKKNKIDLTKIDIIHCLTEPLLPLAYFLRKMKKQKIVLHIVGSYSIIPFLKNNIFEKFFINRIDGGIAISEYSKNIFLKYFGGTALIKNCKLGVDRNIFKKKSGVNREKIIVSIGSLRVRRKGIKYSLRAFRKISLEFPDINYIILENNKKNDSHRLELIKYIEENNLKSRVKILFNVSQEELIEIYNKALFHILPSINSGLKFEGFGLVHLEANACGIPSIGSRDCGNEDAIIDGKTGFLCNQRDVEDIYSKMKIILIEKEKYNLMCENSLTFSKEMSWERVFKCIENVYTNLNKKE